MRSKTFHPESLVLGHGYDHKDHQGAVKCPMFLTSTFAFESAEEGKAFFELAYGLREGAPGEDLGMIYSRIDNPNLQLFERRLAVWDDAEESAVFNSGMAAIATTIMAYLRPGDLLLHSDPVYGGTDHFIQEELTRWGIQVLGFAADMGIEELIELVESTGRAGRLRMIFLETPSNPTNDLFDIHLCRALADHFSHDDKKVLVAVDNTYLGPVGQSPLKQGADLVLYSATKYLGGHSDLIAGACSGDSALITPVKTLRGFFGTMATPQTSWLLTRSLETLHLRFERQVDNARALADFLQNHPAVEAVSYLGLLGPSDGRPYRIFLEQCKAPGAMIAFYIKGGEEEAFRFLNHLYLFRLAVSLGSTESLAQHPATMTHAGVDPDKKEILGITGNLVRLSIGVEHVEDLIWDVEQALEVATSGMQSKGLTLPQYN